MTLAASIINPPLKVILSTFLDVDSSEVAKIPMEGPLILATNHINFLDAPVGFTHLHPRRMTAFAKVETWDNLVLKFLFNAWEAIPIKRGEVDFEAFRMAEEALKQKKLIIVAPEGTRSKHGKLNKGYPGIVLLAIRTGVPIIPVAFFGNENVKIKLARRTAMTIKVGKAFKIDTRGEALSKDVRGQITDEIMYEIARLMPENNRGVYADLKKSSQQYLEFLQ